MISPSARLRCFLIVALLALSAFAASGPVPDQTAGPRPVTAADYARAEKFLAPAVSSLVVGGAESVAWLPDERFTYRRTTLDGTEFILVSPAAKSRGPAFDHVEGRRGAVGGHRKQVRSKEAPFSDDHAFPGRQDGFLRSRAGSAGRAT